MEARDGAGEVAGITDEQAALLRERDRVGAGDIVVEGEERRRLAEVVRVDDRRLDFEGAQL